MHKWFALAFIAGCCSAYASDLHDKEIFENVRDVISMLEKTELKLHLVKTGTTIIGYDEESKMYFTLTLQKKIEKYILNKRDFFLQFGDKNDFRNYHDSLSFTLKNFVQAAINIQDKELFDQAIYYHDLLFKTGTQIHKRLEDILFKYAKLIIDKSDDNGKDKFGTETMFGHILAQLNKEVDVIYKNLSEKIKTYYENAANSSADIISTSSSPKRYTIKFQKLEDQTNKLEKLIEQQNKDVERFLITKDFKNLSNSKLVCGDKYINIEEFKRVEAENRKLLEEVEKLRRSKPKKKLVKKVKRKGAPSKLKKAATEELFTKDSFY